MSAVGFYGAAHVEAAGADELPVAGAVGWWDFSDEDTVTIATGISQIDDKTGNGNHLVQASTGNQPSHITTSLIGGSSRKVASFDGSDDSLATASDITSGAWTIFVVAAKRTANITNGNSDVLFINNERAAYVQPGPSLAIWRGSAASTVTSTSSLWTNAAVHTRQMTATPASSYWIDSTNYVNAAASTTTTGALRVGRGGPSTSDAGDWDVGEIVAYNTALSTSDREAVESFLATKWSI